MKRVDIEKELAPDKAELCQFRVYAHRNGKRTMLATFISKDQAEGFVQGLRMGLNFQNESLDDQTQTPIIRNEW